MEKERTCKTMWTSCYGRLKKLRDQRPELVPVSISAGTPKWAGKILRCKPLTPPWAMVKAGYDEPAFRQAVLDKADAEAVISALPENAVLLCWEKSDERCHRRYVRNWLREHCVTCEEISLEPESA